MSTAEETSYDEVPYDSNPFPQTHPDRLATLATLFGMTPPPPSQARILELGCAAGGNLIPHALNHPEANVVGVDLSARQIADGQQIVDALKLENIKLLHKSITDIDKDFGEFDYIICHGVYSWVPDDVQEHILRIFKDNLSADGVAYVSYNTFPGWHMRGMIRHMMRYHVQQFADPNMQIKQARALHTFLSENVPAERTPNQSPSTAPISTSR